MAKSRFRRTLRKLRPTSVKVGVSGRFSPIYGYARWSPKRRRR